MSPDLPESVQTAFDNHDAYEKTDDGYTLTTTTFEGIVTATPVNEWKHSYTLTVTVPSLDAATADDVGDVVSLDWFETLERRLEDAPKVTRMTVELTEFVVDERDDSVVVTYSFEDGSPEAAAKIAKAFGEYVEGTYAEGIIPGYEYIGAASELLSEASQSGERGTPL